MHAAGFIAVSRRFHSLGRMLRRCVPHEYWDRAKCAIPGLWWADATWPSTRRLADSNAVRQEVFGPVRVTAAVEDDAERAALDFIPVALIAKPIPSNESHWSK
jgi:hypothetical protein